MEGLRVNENYQLTECLNCRQELGLGFNYCRNCGAKVQSRRFTFRRMVEEFGERVLNLDNSVFLTYAHLFTKPEVVIGGFLTGLRKRYLNAINYFTLAVTISGLQLYIMKKYYPNAMAGYPIYEQSRGLTEFMLDYQSLVMFMYIPILAFMAWLTFLTLKRHNYVEHLIVQLYTFSHWAIHSAIFGILTLVLGIDYFLFTIVMMISFVLYSAYVFKCLYSLSFGGILLRTLLFLSILGVVYFIVTIIVIVTMLIAMGPEELLRMSQEMNASGQP
ncbi:MAG: DUF3667 domain-containing protein [Leeuwenhoekiella sp.]